MSMRTLRTAHSVETCLLYGLLGLIGCGGEVDLTALTTAGGSSGAGGAMGNYGAAAGLCAQSGCVSPMDAGTTAVCFYNGSVYSAGMSFRATDGCNSCGCDWTGTVGCTQIACLSGVGGSVSVGAAASTGGAGAVGGSPSTGGVRAIVPACPGLDISATSPDGGPQSSFPQCMGVASESEAVPVDLFIMLDRSQSMTNILQGSSIDRWDAIEQGLQTFITNSAANMTGVGLGYFGKTGNPNDPAECDPNTYAQPVVPIDYLSNNSAALVQSVTAERAILGGQAPWFPALQGGLQFTQQWQTANPSHRTVFIFVTDGYATECDTDMTDITTLVSNAFQAQGVFAGGPSIYTFVIGIAGGQFNLDAVAQAGGTLQSTIVDGLTAPDEFAAALQNDILLSNTAYLSCDIGLPFPPPGLVIDPTMVQIIYQPFGGNDQEIPETQSDATCGGPNGGWYYDNATAPTKITLCPCSCANLTNGSLQVRFGCRPIPLN